MVVFSVALLALAIAVFVVRYAARAPWWRTLEGRTIVGMMLTFFLILVNLIVHRITGWAWYEGILTLLMLVGAGFMVSQNVVLTRARKRAAARRRAREEGSGGV